MTKSEKEFVKRWNAMLNAAKEMEKEGFIKTDFGFKLKSKDSYLIERQILALKLNEGFLNYGYKLEE